MIAAVIFDMDGLMFDTEPVWYRSWEPVLTKHGLIMTEELFRDCLGTSFEGAIEVMRRHFGDEVDVRGIYEERWELARKMLLSECVPEKPGLRELLAFLDEREMPLAVASSSSREMVESHLQKHGMEDRFDVIVSGAEVERSKPAPDIFLKAASELGVEPADALVLEDAPNGIRAAAAGGFRSVMVPDVLQPDEEMASLAGHVCRDLLEVRDLIAADEL